MSEPSKLTYGDWPPGEALGLRRLAHDLMTPITVLMGNLQLFLMRKDLPPPVAAKIEDLYKQTQNLMRLIQDAQKHAYDIVWTGQSGPIADRWQDGIEVASSVLTRSGIAVLTNEQKPADEWRGEPEAWREWCGSLYANIANRLERGGKIELAAIDNGWSLKAYKLNAETDYFSNWMAVMCGSVDASDVAGFRRYWELLHLNKCNPEVIIDTESITINFRLGSAG